MISYGGFLSHRGTPSSHPFINGISIINHPAIGYFPHFRKPPNIIPIVWTITYKYIIQIPYMNPFFLCCYPNCSIKIHPFSLGLATPASPKRGVRSRDSRWSGGEGTCRCSTWLRPGWIQSNTHCASLFK